MKITMPSTGRTRKRRGATSKDRDSKAIADRLHSVAIHLLRGLRAADRASGLSGPRLSALSVIVFRAPITLTDLAAAEQVRAPTMSRLVRTLEAGGLVMRRTDPGDGRVVLFRATPRGVRLLQAGRARRVASLADAMDRLPPADQDIIRRALEVLEPLAASLRDPRA